MKRMLFVLSVLLIGTGVLFAAGAQESSAGKPVELVYTMTAVPTDAHAGAMRVFKETVERVSGGQIKVLTYDSASLFKQEQEVSAVKSGQADMTATAAPWLTDGSPWVSMFTAGYIFKSYDHMTTVLNGEVGKQVFDRIAKEQGIRPLGAQYLGTRQLNLVEDRHIKTPADLKGVNLRMPNSDAWLFLGRALGANPTPISFSELYMALQTKTVDGQDNPLPSTKNAKFFEVTKSITLTNHLVDSVWPAINEAKWQSLTSQQQEWVMEGVRAGVEYCDTTNLKAEAELVQFFRDAGLSVYEADVDAFSEHVLAQYLNSDFSKTWNLEFFEKVQAAAK
ncbi:MAG: C4-dicarboxylate ABC transporter substrate-binding protein [Spirochaetae bacterium HGW-Spirochaetae-4]|jgi:tripartite ATP-independent transporter DctP family solute receptor|nr:MAG: C4-dicarboxylate ABC transporter substrate-binding protein [Spirochaetes bacterium GWC2_52_13]PKL12416.1 MAG: C4-dicarboxylate ABC transporter substrate-binding protein [Spirochaetae bacterium HGW-Spirochaetae-8]PKL20846.1 MAG: C4-dicarboxylate ABC transporter substrate-binding protein [Spirochaetae bacterium HGW-Spirochaetae-4]HCG62742.1 C4-dicarboxylate ABC transporter substrate-binding protein [Sphaerochaeta sp.]HCS36863.1 C4-dicarboxylate ABC transporter substrate-binding protein [S